MDDNTGREREEEKEQEKEQVAINNMTHSFCSGYFLTAFIKANLIILAR